MFAPLRDSTSAALNVVVEAGSVTLSEPFRIASRAGGPQSYAGVTDRVALCAQTATCQIRTRCAGYQKAAGISESML